MVRGAGCDGKLAFVAAGGVLMIREWRLRDDEYIVGELDEGSGKCRPVSKDRGRVEAENREEAGIPLCREASPNCSFYRSQWDQYRGSLK